MYVSQLFINEPITKSFSIKSLLSMIFKAIIRVPKYNVFSYTVPHLN